MSAKLISIIGPPAVGKTTLAGLLCRELPAEMIREDWDGNPFLAESYDGAAMARLPGQIYFLMSRVTQLAQAAWPDSGIFVSDYGFCQDRIFAQVRLDQADYELYDPLARRLEELVHPPDLLVRLDAEQATLAGRIAYRGRAFEHVMDGPFLSCMRTAYVQAQLEARCPVVEFNCDATDFRESEVLESLVQQIRRTVGVLV
jgi:deoxyguanosine kinase